MNKKLIELRQQIDKIDKKILTLIGNRAELLTSILQSKIDYANTDDVPIFHPKREQDIIQNLILDNNSMLSDLDITSIYQSIISASRNFQFKNTKNARPFKLTVQGDKGSFSEKAALQYCQSKSLKHYDIHYATNSENVLNQLSTDPHHYGVVALNNAQGGLVEETIDAFSRYKYLIIDSIIYRVKHSLLSLPGKDKKNIKKIYSHSQALRQCQYYLKTQLPNCERIPWQDTALAAADLFARKLPPNSAVIAHQSCADQTDLVSLEDNIQDLGMHNETLFLLITGYTHE